MIRSPLRLALVLALTASLGGCISLLPKAKPAQLFRFGTGEGTPAPQAPNARGVTLGEIGFPRESTGDGILTLDGTETSYLANARWVAPATVLFRQTLARSFDAAAPHTRLLQHGEVGRTNAILQLDVSRFEARYPAPKAAPTVEVTLLAHLSGADGAPLASQVFDVSKPAAANRIAAIVAAYDEATTEATTSLARWVEQNTPDTQRIGSTSAATSTKSTSTSTTTTTRQP